MNRWLLTAEHAGNDIPKEWQNLFIGKKQILQTHEGYDPGTLKLSEQLSPLADSTLVYPYTRLLIEVNRSIGHPKLFSAFTKSLSSAKRQELIERLYKPHWNAVEKQIRQWINQGDEVYHIGVHSFTPVLNGEVRHADIGLLYDPKRKVEKRWADEWKPLLEWSGFKVRRNYPYLGKADGLITQLRRKFPEHYQGIELEINQQFVGYDGRFATNITQAIKRSIEQLKFTV